MSDAWDLSELNTLALDLGKGNALLVTQARKIIEVAAQKIKKEMANEARGIGHAPSFPDSITYDVHGLEAEIGPDKSRRQGALGNILYFGTSHNGPVIADIAKPLKAEAPIVADLIAKAAAEGIL